MRELLVLVVVAIGTYAMRVVFLATAGTTPPRVVARLLPHVGPAVLAAITVPALLAPRGVLSATETLPALVAAAIAWWLWRRLASLPAALFGGLGAWWAAGWLPGLL